MNFIKLNAVYYDKDMEPKRYEITVNVDTISRVEPATVGKNWVHQSYVVLNDKTCIYVKDSYRKVVDLLGTKNKAIKGMISVTVIKYENKHGRLKDIGPDKLSFATRDITAVSEREDGTHMVFQGIEFVCKESYSKVMKMIREAQRA